MKLEADAGVCGIVDRLLTRLSSLPASVLLRLFFCMSWAFLLSDFSLFFQLLEPGNLVDLLGLGPDLEEGALHGELHHRDGIGTY